MGCSCKASEETKPKLIFSCSGAADVGELSDRVARKLTREGAGKMFCLAGVGGKVENILKVTNSADSILAIDGCPMNCTKACLEEAGFYDFSHLELSSMNIKKGSTDISESNIEKVTSKCKTLL